MALRTRIARNFLALSALTALSSCAYYGGYGGYPTPAHPGPSQSPVPVPAEDVLGPNAQNAGTAKEGRYKLPSGPHRELGNSK